MKERGTIISIRFRPDELSKLLDAIKMADPHGQTTPGAFLKRTVLACCDQSLTSPTHGAPSEDPGGSVVTMEAAASSLPNPENETVFPAASQAHPPVEHASSDRPSPPERRPTASPGFAGELDQARKLVSSVHVQTCETVDWIHENSRNCMRDNAEFLDEARQRVKESVNTLAANSKEIVVAFRKYAQETTETLDEVATATLRVADNLQAENLRVRLKTFLAAALAAAFVALPAFGWFAWRNSRLESRAEAWRKSAEVVNQYVVEALYPRMDEKERAEANSFYKENRLPTPEDQTRAWTQQ
ncbi:MAG: hypothetical protein AB1640_06900 [bacterium]